MHDVMHVIVLYMTQSVWMALTAIVHLEPVLNARCESI